MICLLSIFFVLPLSMWPTSKLQYARSHTKPVSHQNAAHRGKRISNWWRITSHMMGSLPRPRMNYCTGLPAQGPGAKGPWGPWSPSLHATISVLSLQHYIYWYLKGPMQGWRFGLSFGGDPFLKNVGWKRKSKCVSVDRPHRSSSPKMHLSETTS